MTETTARPRLHAARGDRLAGLLVAGGLAGFVAVVYVVVVLGGGILVGHTSTPDVALSIIATVIVALGFEPVRTRLHTWAQDAVLGGRPSPYDVLRQFSTTVSGSSASEEIPPRMAQVLAEGTSAEWAQVWLIVHGVPRLAATWPSSVDTAGFTPLEDRPGVRVRPVRERGELLGMLVVQEQPGLALGPVEQRLFAGLAQQAGLALRGTRLHTELVEQAALLSSQAAQLQRSRERVVDAHDEGRRRLERDIHDGAQQHLVALAVNLRLAQTLAERAPDRADRVLADQETAVAAAVQTLVDLSRGIYPRALSEQGLMAALREAVAASPVPVTLTEHELGRYVASTEASLYFCALEALQNATKHAGASNIRLDVTATDDHLTMTVEDDGQGFELDQQDPGSGLSNMRDRVDSVGGTVLVESQPGRGTRVEVSVPATRLAGQGGD